MDKNYNKLDNIGSDNVEFSKSEFDRGVVYEIAQSPYLLDIPPIATKREKSGGTD
jgi:hypothetical protein